MVDYPSHYDSPKCRLHRGRTAIEWGFRWRG
jgi:hypothetical protein